MITRIEVYRYRCFSKLAVELGEYNVLAGANGSGKTTLLDIPILLGDLLTQRICSAAFLEIQPSRGAPRAHTLDELIHQGRGEDFVLVVEAALPGHIVKQVAEPPKGAVQAKVGRWPTHLTHLRYELRFQVFNNIELHILNEYLFLFSENGKRPELGGGLQGEPISYLKSGHPRLQQGWQSLLNREKGEITQIFERKNKTRHVLKVRVPPHQLALASVPYDRESYPVHTWFQDFLRAGAIFFDPDWRTLRGASPPGQPNHFLPNGLSHPWLALHLQKTEPERFQDWIEHVQTALPQIENIEVCEREEDHHAYFRIHYQGGYIVTSSGLSEGTLRTLCLTLLPYVRTRPALLLTEEPENSLHPQAIETVLQSLQSLYGSQVWFSTHSPIVLAHTDLSHILCMRLTKTGAVEAVLGDQHPRLEQWRGELDLGSLFAAGVLD